MAVWNLGFENDPSGADSPSSGDDEIRKLKSAIEERMRNEHFTYQNNSSEDGALYTDWYHQPGSATAYFQDTEPSNYPAGNRALDSEAHGKIWVNDNTEGTRPIYVYEWDSTAGTGSFVRVIIRYVTRISVQGALPVGNDLIPPVIFPHGASLTKVSARLKDAPVGAGLRFDLEDSAGNSLFSAGYLQIDDGTNAANTTSLTSYANLSDDDYLMLDITQVGSNFPGAHLSIALMGELE